MEEPTQGWDRLLEQSRENLSYLLGFGLTIWEAIWRHGQDPAVVTVCVILLGLGEVRKGDKRREQRRREADR